MNQSKTRLYEEIVAEVKDDFKSRQEERLPYELAWQLNMNFVAGNQYCQISRRGIEKEDKEYGWQCRDVYNHIATIYETRLAKLSRVKPKMSVRPVGAEDGDVMSAKVSSKILQSCSEKLRLTALMDNATMWSEVCGTVFYKICWDKSSGGVLPSPTSELKSGDVGVSVCPPFEIYPDSNTCQSMAEVNSLIHAKVYTVEEVKSIWGADVKGEDVKVFAPGSVAVTGGYGVNGFSANITEQVKKNAVTVIERYTRPCSKYPDGQLVIVAGDSILYIGELPYFNGENGERNLPFVRQVSTLTAGCFWGTSVVERLIPVQRAYNAVKNRKQEFLNRISMGVLAVEEGSVDPDELTDGGLSPGKVLTYRQGANLPRLLDAGNLPSEFLYEEERLLTEFLEVSGVSELMRNSSTTQNITSGVALQLLIEQDDTRLNISADQIRCAIRDVARQILRLYRQFAVTKRIEKVVGEDGAVEVFYFKNSDLTSDDVIFETENEINDTPSARRALVMDLLSAGLLTDKDGKISQAGKLKILEMMGFGNWESSQDVATLHQRKAQKENLFFADDTKPLEIDDHAIHIEEHVKHVVSGLARKQGKEYEQKLLAHIRLHQIMSNVTQTNEEGESGNGE